VPGVVVHREGPVAYASGGVGADGRESLAAVAGSFSLEILASRRDGAFVGAPRISIAEVSGGLVLDTVAEGPVFDADLPPGRYTVVGRVDGQDQHRSVTIVAGRRSVLALRFGAGTASATGSRAPAPDEGESLYSLDPSAVDRAKKVVTSEIVTAPPQPSSTGALVPAAGAMDPVAGAARRPPPATSGGVSATVSSYQAAQDAGGSSRERAHATPSAPTYGPSYPAYGGSRVPNAGLPPATLPER